MAFDMAGLALTAAAAAGLGGGAATWWFRRRRGAVASRAAAQAAVAQDVDPATGLMTRARFESVLQDRLLAAEQQGLDCCVLHVGLDDFRLVADDAGPALAEKALAVAAARLRALGGTSTPMARVAAEEFAICLNAPRDAGEKAALRIAQAMAAPLNVDGRELEVGASVGLAVAPEHGNGPRLLGKAAAATRAVQRSGGGAHAVFDPRIEAEHNSEVSMARDLQDAAGKGQLELFYQPKIDARRLEVGAVEALLRWRHPAHGLVSPARFVPIAERQGLIDALGRWALDHALEQAASWRKVGHGFGVAVNVAGAQFRRDDFAAGLARALKTRGVPSEALVCEIAEAVALEDTEATRQAFVRLHKVGVRIAIGGFGGHAAGLAALERLPVHELKLDRGLVAALSAAAGESGAAVARIVAAAHARGLRVVAEGVENEAQRDAAVRLGCDDLQGYLFAKPMSARAVGIWSADANANLAQTLRCASFADTQPYVAGRSVPPEAFAQTRIVLRR